MFAGGLFYICALRIVYILSFELAETKNYISALFPGEIINYIYKVEASSVETFLTFLSPSFS